MCGSHFSLWSLPSLCINWGHLRPISLKVPWHPQKKQLGVHIWEGNFVLWYIFWCPPPTHDKFVHVWGGKWKKFCRCIRFCPRLGGCPRKPVSTYDKFYCILYLKTPLVSIWYIRRIAKKVKLYSEKMNYFIIATRNSIFPVNRMEFHISCHARL